MEGAGLVPHAKVATGAKVQALTVFQNGSKRFRIEMNWVNCAKSRPRTARLAFVLLLVLAGWFCFHRWLQQPLDFHLLLSLDSPREEYFNELANTSGDPVVFLQRCWATGKIAHRGLVAIYLKDHAAAAPAWFSRAEPLAVEAAQDADESVRELALATLELSHSTNLFPCVRAQLNDCDPSMRLLGLHYLGRRDPREAVPAAMPLLDDPDLQVVAAAEVALMRWTGEDFGVRNRLVVEAQGTNEPTASELADAALIREGVAKRKQWWQLHSAEFPPLLQSTEVHTIAPSSWEPDFTLKDLQGRRFHIAGSRGKVVLLNFWATWCTACVAEMPELIALQKEMGDRVKIIGVALDSPGDTNGASMKTVRAMVARAVKARGINYSVLLDPTAKVAAKFNGGELPTTVILDPQGHICRRFLGGRSLSVFKAMIQEADKSSPAAVRP